MRTILFSNRITGVSRQIVSTPWLLRWLTVELKTIVTGSPDAQTPLIPFTIQLLISPTSAIYISSRESVMHNFALVKYKWTCFILLVPLFVKTDARYQIVAPPSSPQRWLAFCLNSRSFPLLASPLPIFYLNLESLGVGGGENLLLNANAGGRLKLVELA